MKRDGESGPLHFSTLCVVDDDARMFEFRFTVRTTDLVSKASAAVARGRRVRCYIVRGDSQEHEREERFLVSRGYRTGEIKL